MALVTLTFDRLIVVAWHNFWNRRTLWACARGPIATWWTSVRVSKCKIAKTEQNWASKLGIKTTHPVSWKSAISEVQALKQTWHILDVGSDVSDPQCSKIWCSKSARLRVLKTIVLFKDSNNLCFKLRPLSISPSVMSIDPICRFPCWGQTPCHRRPCQMF